MRFSVLPLFLLGFFLAQAQFSPVGVIGAERLEIPQLSRPTGATFGFDGLLYFINENSDEIFVYTANGEFIKSISTIFNGVAFKPNSIAINDAGLIYLASYYSAAIAFLDTEGNFLQQKGSFGSGSDQFAYPSGIDLDEEGNIWVADAGNSRIKKFSESGVYISEFVSIAPGGIDVTNNAIYVMEIGDIVRKYTLNGVLIDEIVVPNSPWSHPIVIAEDYFSIATSAGVSLCNLVDNSITPIPEPQNDYLILSTGLALQDGKLFITDLHNRVFKYDLQLNSLEVFLDCKADGQFNYPTQIARDNDQNIYVTDQYNHRIQVFDSEGNFIRKFGSYGFNNGELRFPQDIAVDSNGDCYVMSNNGVSVFNNQGIFLRQFNVSGYGVIALDQNYVYIIGSSPVGIHRLDKNGVFQELIIEGGTEPDKVDGARDFVIDEAGNFYVAEMVGRVQVLNNNGVSLQTIGQEGTGDGEFSSPWGIARDDQGRIYVTDDLDPFDGSRAQVFDQNGNLIAIIGEGSFKYPRGITVNSDGRVYVSEAFNHRIQIFKSLAEPEINVNVPEKTYGDPEFELDVSSNSEGVFSFSILEGTAAEISPEGLITILEAGLVSIEIRQAATAEYSEGVLVVQLEIAKANLVVSVDNHSRIYGEEDPVFTVQYSGFKYSDTFSDLDSEPLLSTQATIDSPVGEYSIDADHASDNNYEISYVSGVLTINKAPLTAKAEDKSRVFNSENPEFTIEYTGFKINEDALTLEEAPTASTLATEDSPVGQYPIEVTGGVAVNYEFSYINGQLTITKANQVITFEPLTSPVLNTLPPFTLEATSDSDLQVNYAVSSGPASVSFALLTLSGELGTVTIEASQSGNENYNPATPVSRSFEVILDPILGVDEGLGDISIYPNPATDEFFIESPSMKILKVFLVDSKGIKIDLNSQIMNDKLVVDIRFVPNGLYVLRMQVNSGQELLRKILVRK